VGSVEDVTELGPDLDAARRDVAARGLVPDAVTQLNQIVAALPLDTLAPVKQHLKRFFSDSPWTEQDDNALADLIGAGDGGGEYELAPGLTLVWQWLGGRFRLRVEQAETNDDGDPWAADAGDSPGTTDLEASFDGPVVPEATPSPRTIRFATAAIHGGPSRSYESADDAAGDPRAARLFREFAAVTSVLVGPDFVAVSLDRPGSWESLLAPVLATVTEEFAGEPTGDTEPAPATTGTAPVTRSLSVGTARDDVARPRHLERAWTELGGLDPRRVRDLDRLLAASEDREPARRQVAATLLAEGPRDLATRAWSRLLNDRSRLVRRSVVDAMVDTDWPEVRSLLEDALGDDDPWVRWKALKGIAGLGTAPSRDAVAARRDDPDFRVRLEAAAALRQAH
jgi:hypothetical protein